MEHQQKKDSNLDNSIQTDHNIYAKVELQLDMLDCNYEHDKREYYAQLIRDFQKTIPINELDKTLKNQIAVPIIQIHIIKHMNNNIELQLDMLDYNYEHDKREYYAQLIRDFQKTIPINELDKALKNQVRY
ncbi:unnamed protein product [Rotaria sordida]|uniref:Uncharacterized protein n=1 Tax=Rotaria sordida TaxID=392033 RepID=A0A814IFP2_9BILA|nr:unnamed protein product [Rotaria sordida]